MANYSFANCILHKAPYLTHFATVSTSVLNMRTEGIVRLLDGESIAMDQEDKNAVMASPLWQDFVQRYAVAESEWLPKFDVFEPLSLSSEDAFLWSPFADTLCSFTTARCTDGSPYPCVCDPINAFFPHRPRTDLEHCEQQWNLMADRLTHVKRKAVILYLPDTIQYPAFTPEHAEELRLHVTKYNERAVETLEPRGWKVFAPPHVHCPPNNHWAHYSPDVVKSMKMTVEQFLG